MEIEGVPLCPRQIGCSVGQVCGRNISRCLYLQSCVDVSGECLDGQRRTEGVMDLYGWLEMQSVTMQQRGYPTSPVATGDLVNNNTGLGHAWSSAHAHSHRPLAGTCLRLWIFACLGLLGLLGEPNARPTSDRRHRLYRRNMQRAEDGRRPVSTALGREGCSCSHYLQHDEYS